MYSCEPVYSKTNLKQRPIEIYLLCALLLFLAIGALYGGAALMIRPDGSLLHMEPWLDKIVFGNFFLPGLILFIFLGLLPLFTIIGLMFRPNWNWPHRINLYSNRHWAWAFSLYGGIMAIAWIIIQQLMTDYFILQPVIAMTGLLIIVLTLLPRVIQYYEQ